MYISHVQCALQCMCTFVRTSERDGWRRTKSIFFFSRFSSSSRFFLFLSLSLSFSRAKKRKSLKFSLVRIHICTACCFLAYILTIDSTSSYEISESKSQTSREDDGNDNRKKKERWRVRKREKERPVRWTMMMLVTERTSSGVRRTELNGRMMDGWTPLQGQGNKRTFYENEFVVNSVNCTFISFFLCMN
jgi:hypothetical protein